MISTRNFAFYLFSTLLITYQTPKDWWKSKPVKIFLVCFYGIGYLSIVSLFSIFYKIPDGILKSTISVLINVYYAFIINAVVLCILRFSLHYIIKRFKHNFFYKLIDSSKVYFLTVIIFTLIYLVGGYINTKDFFIQKYNVTIDGYNLNEDLDILQISDLHLGAGLNISETNKCIDKMSGLDYDVLLITGDLVDGNTSLADLENFVEKARNLHDVYYIKGNHDDECRYDYLYFFKQANINILDDKEIKLDNNIYLSGLNAKESSIKELPTITIGHSPIKMRDFTNKTDIALFGHTHGYAMYLYLFSDSLMYEVPVGYKKIENTHFIISSGASGWGFKLKWPSKNEIVLIHARFS